MKESKRKSRFDTIFYLGDETNRWGFRETTTSSVRVEETHRKTGEHVSGVFE